MKLYALAAAFFALATSANAATYSVDTAKSSIVFSGTHAGNPFKGTFEKWTAAIEFDPAALSKSSIDVTIDTASAKTGNPMYDGTLPSTDWFGVKEYPQARFVSSELSKNTDGTYTAKGSLTLRDVTLPVSFTFELIPSDLSTPEVTSHASLVLDRLAFNIGKNSDGKAEWVSRDITITLSLLALKQPNGQ